MIAGAAEDTGLSVAQVKVSLNQEHILAINELLFAALDQKEELFEKAC